MIRIKPMILAALCLFIAGQPAHAFKRDGLPPVKDHSLWFRYYVAGEKQYERRQNGKNRGKDREGNENREGSEIGKTSRKTRCEAGC